MIAFDELFEGRWPPCWDEPRILRGAGRSLHDLLDWADLEQILATQCFEGSASAAIADALKLDAGPSRVCVIRGGTEIWRVPRQVDAATFAARLSGSTLRIEAVEEVHAPVRAFADRLSSVAPAVYCNVYAAWGRVPGLGLHYDYTDILVLQLRGEKHWKIYRPTRAAVRGAESSAYKELLQRAERGEADGREALKQVLDGFFWEGVLNSGDALFVPPGWFHSVAPTGAPTLHLSCAFNAPPGSGGSTPAISLPDALLGALD